MDRLLFLAMTGAKHVQMAQTNNANNLANVSTAGFRADFQSLVAKPIDGPGYATRVNGWIEETTTDFTPGAVMSTGRDLDVAIRGDGWFAVRAGDGSEGYSRRGDFSLTSDGMLINGAGQPVLGDGGPVAIPDHQSLMIGDDGTVSIVPLGQGPETQVIVDRIKLVKAKPEQLEKSADGLMRLRDGTQAPASAEVRISAGNLESANVNAVDAMVDMIALARQFEMQVKVMKSAETMDEAGARLMRLE